MPLSTPLSHRSLIRLNGVDRVAFLQGLISNDVSKATTRQAVYAALLTPQGKFLHDMFVIARDDAFLIECEAARADDLVRRLAAYKLRAKITLENLGDAFEVWAVWGEQIAPAAGQSIPPIVFPDPRLPELGHRVWVEKGHTPAGTETASFAAYETLRLTLGVPDGSRDMEIEKSTLAEGNFDYLNGIDWKKGCYVGQELTARMHYRGLAKRRLFPVRIEGAVAPLPDFIRSACGDRALALLEIAAVEAAIKEKAPIHWGNTRIYPFWPGWMPQKT